MTRSFERPGAKPGAGDDRDGNDARIQEDLVLIERVGSGSIPHWHAFVDRYSGLIYSVIRRQLFAEDEDEIRGVFTDVLAALYEGKLAEYQGRSKLSTWLIVISRGKALDYLRSRDGRRKLPRDHHQLSPFEQEVFRLHNVEGLAFDAVIRSLRARGHRASAEDVAHAAIRIENLFDANYLKRLEYEARAPMLGVVSGRMLQFFQRMDLAREQSSDGRPDYELERKELAALADRVRDLLSQLDDEEREVVRLRFEEGLTARRIAEELGMGGQRRVYTVLDRALRKLRTLLQLGEDE